jgi:hypothetical protein
MVDDAMLERQSSVGQGRKALSELSVIASYSPLNKQLI